MNRLLLLILIAIGLAHPESSIAYDSSSNSSHLYRGEAVDTERGGPAYSEEKLEKFQGGRQIGTYTKFLSPNGNPQGELHLDFTHFTCKPEYAYKDFRNGYEEGSQVLGKEIRVYFRDSSRTPLKEKKLQVPEPCVVNGGVGPFLRQNLKALESGQRVPFNMVVPARLDYYKFITYVDPKRTLPGKSTGDRPYRAMVIEPENSLLRMVLPTIVIFFDQATLKMICYQGISNVADKKGRSLRVRVDYQAKDQ